MQSASVNSHLNQEQHDAVKHENGPLLIIAGAGTGKTTVVVEKIKHLIAEGLAKPEEILALTFTEKAALEMEDRVDRAIPYGYFQMFIGTFHSFADQILRQELSHIGMGSDYKLLAQAETILFLRRNLFAFDLNYFRPRGNPQKFIAALLQLFSRLKDEDISPEEYLKWAENTTEDPEQNRELAHAYKTYQKLKMKENYFDFGDLLSYILELFRKRPAILQKYQKQFKYVLVDEFQDTNIAQYQLIKLLCPTDINPNLTVVGDDSQAIYKFRGASVSNILTFKSDYPTAEQVTLLTNYRSYQEILDISYRSIQHNDPDTLEAQLGISKKLKAKRGAKQNVVGFCIADTIGEETEYVAKQILELKKKHSYAFSDFALLVRANGHADPFLTAFSQRGIPYRFLGLGMLFKRPEIKDLIAYLKFLYNIEDTVSLYRVLSMELFAIDQKDLSLLLAFSKKTSLCLFQAIEVVLSFTYPELAKEEFAVYKNYLPFIDVHTKEILWKIYQMLHRHIGLLKKETAGHILYYFLEDTGLLKKLAAVESEREEIIALNITRFFEKLKSFEMQHEDASVFAVVDYLQMSMELGESPLAAETNAVNYDAVNVMTIHGAKGLEFPVVFLVNLSRGRFPTYEKKETFPLPAELIKEVLPQGDYHLQEERRLFYVGVTRAKDKVFFSLSQTYSEGKRERKISPFIVEALGEEAISKFVSIKKEEKTQLSIFDFKKIEEPVVKQPLSLSNFSFSQLESFAICPLQYKYQHILKIPGTPSSAAAFGETIHKTLQRFYQEYMVDHTVGLDRLLSLYNELWIPIGYQSMKHQENARVEGKLMLTEFFTKHHVPTIKPIGLEKFFKIRLDTGTFVTGKIDRIDQTADGGIEIVDYKTGRKPEEKELKKSLQLSIYALAAMDKGLYNKPLSLVTLTFYYLEDGSKVSMKRAPEEMAEVVDKITRTVDTIRSDQFEPKVGPWCNFCSYKMICKAW